MGSEQQNTYYKKIATNLGITQQIIWHGNLNNAKVLALMKKADLFFLTSVSEDTSTVVLEAISSQLPVLCFDACGFGHVINEKVGIKIPLSTPKYRDWETDRKSTRLNSSHITRSRMPSSA